MRRALWRVARGDLAARPLQTAILGVVLLIAAAGITAGLGQRQSASRAWDDAVRRTNGPDVAIYGRDSAALTPVAADPAVRQASGPFDVIGSTDLVLGATRTRLPLRAAVQAPVVGRPFLVKGRWLDPGATDEVVIERSFALSKGIATGDRLQVEGPGGQVTLTVVGQVVDTLDCFVPQCGSQFGWVAPAALDKVDPGRTERRSLVLLNLHDRATVGAFAAALFARSGDEIISVNDWQDTRKDALSTNDAFAAFLSALGLVLLVAAALVVMTSVMGRVLSRYREIGVLKAVGFTPRAVTALVLGEHVTIAGLTAVAGFVIGCGVAPFMQLRLATVLGRGGVSFPAGTLVLTVVVVEVLVAGATLLPAWRAGRIPASRAITQGAVPPRAHVSRLARLAAALRMRAPVVTGVKDATARPLRAALTVVTLAITAVSIVVTMGFQRTVSGMAGNTAVLGDPYDIVVVPQGAARPDVETALRDPRVSTWFTATSRRASTGVESGTFQLRALGGDVAGSGFVVREGRMVRSADETIVGYGLLRRLGLHVGDRVSMTVSGVALPLTVVGWYSETEDSGEIAQVTMDALRRAEPGAPEGEYFVRLRSSGDQRAVRTSLAAALGEGARVEAVSENMDDLNAFQAAFLGVTVLVLVVGLVNLAATTALGIREHLRDMAVLKTVGFTPRQVGESVATSTGLLGLAAAALGLPIGLVVFNWLTSGVGASTGMGPGFGVAPTWVSLALILPAALLVTAAVGVLTSRGAARAQVAEVLRAE